LTLGRGVPTLSKMELHLTPEEENRLEEIAQHQGTTAEAFMLEVVRGLLEESELMREAVREGLRQADLGMFIEQEEMDARVQAMLSRAE
jgi:predicted transcriptional regulator